MGVVGRAMAARTAGAGLPATVCNRRPQVADTPAADRLRGRNSRGIGAGGDDVAAVGRELRKGMHT
jgi:3-hydroxyisobutyrate dehydrogenase-like beta-hydroxyacid dehydrogenase